MTHLGSRVSALLDGRLAPGEEERCWNHVHECHACRDLVEHEGWVKTQLAQLSFGPTPTSDSPQVLSARRLQRSWRRPVRHRGPPSASSAWSPSAAARRVRCVVGVLALGVAGSPRVEPLPPVTDLSGPSSPATGPAQDRGDRARRGPSPPPERPWLTASWRFGRRLLRERRPRQRSADPRRADPAPGRVACVRGRAGRPTRQRQSRVRPLRRRRRARRGRPARVAPAARPEPVERHPHPAAAPGAGVRPLRSLCPAARFPAWIPAARIPAARTPRPVRSRPLSLRGTRSRAAPRRSLSGRGPQ